MGNNVCPRCRSKVWWWRDDDCCSKCEDQTVVGVGETLSHGEDVACNGRVLCRRCNRLAENIIVATANNWQQIGIKIVENHSHYYWGHCKPCQEKR